MDYYFQLNTKYGLSLQRAEYLFNDLSGKQPWYFDNYLKNICGMSADDIIETKLNFLYHVMEILTRKRFLGGLYRGRGSKLAEHLRDLQNPSMGIFYDSSL